MVETPEGVQEVERLGVRLLETRLLTPVAAACGQQQRVISTLSSASRGHTPSGGQQCAVQARLSRHKQLTPPFYIGQVSIAAVSLMALHSFDELSARVVFCALQALAPALLMNVCIVGFNQVCDVEIDKVNKPYLPLASGEFSLGVGQALVLTSGVASLVLGARALDLRFLELRWFSRPGVFTGSAPLLLTLVARRVVCMEKAPNL